jgi:hypothetical protein
VQPVAVACLRVVTDQQRQLDHERGHLTVGTLLRLDCGGPGERCLDRLRGLGCRCLTERVPDLLVPLVVMRSLAHVAR